MSNVNRLENQKRWRHKTNNASTKRYEKTKNGFLMRIYRNMKSRVSGIQREKAYLYLGKSILPKEKFYSWALGNKDFHSLFIEWAKNDYDRRLTPTVNRIDPSKGYTIKNMEWITHSENSSLGAKQRILSPQK